MDENSPDPIQSAGLFEGDIAGVNASDIYIFSGVSRFPKFSFHVAKLEFVQNFFSAFNWINPNSIAKPKN